MLKLTFYHTILNHLNKNPFEIIVGKGENDGKASVTITPK